jgi:hypothetical protein
LEEILPVLVTCDNSFRAGADQFIKHINIFVEQFNEVEPLENYIQLIVTKTP